MVRVTQLQGSFATAGDTCPTRTSGLAEVMAMVMVVMMVVIIVTTTITAAKARPAKMFISCKPSKKHGKK